VRFDQLYQSYFAEIYAYVARRKSRHEVPDLVAEVFARTWRRIDAVPARPEDRLWLYGVARRVLTQEEPTTARRHALVNRLMHTRSISQEPSVVDESDVAAQLRTLIAHLKPFDREVVRLIAWESLTHAEVALVLGCSANAVGIRWHRSIGRLRKGLAALSGPRLDDTLRQPQQESHGD
jgi:RNA polymerase sigma-70 factor (ECF subfamily)